MADNTQHTLRASIGAHQHVSHVEWSGIDDLDAPKRCTSTSVCSHLLLFLYFYIDQIALMF